MVPALVAGLVAAWLQGAAPAVPQPQPAASASTPAAAPATALLVVGGTILSNDSDQGAVEALLAVDGFVRALGPEPQVRAAAEGLQAVVLDLGGATAVPGFTDAHVQLGAFGADEDVVDLRAAGTMDEVCALMAARADETRTGRWVQGWGIDRTLWRDGVEPSHAPLSVAVPKHPVAIATRGGHGLLVNAEVLERAGLDGPLHGSLRYDDGRLLVDGEGRARGLFLDGAMSRLRDLLPELTIQQRRERFLRAQDELLARGVTCVHDMGTPPELLPVLVDLRARGLLKLRVLSYLSLDAAGSERRLAEVAVARDPRGLLELRGLHMTLDGPLEWRGAALANDYGDMKGERGYVRPEQSRVTRLLTLATRHSLQPAFCAEGDRAARMAVDTIESVGFVQRELQALRPRIEGLRYVALRDWKRFPELGLVPVMLPDRALDQDELIRRSLGAERAGAAHVWWVLAPDLGPIAYGSGYPNGDPDPLAGLVAARRLLGWAIDARDDVQAGVDPVRVAMSGFTSAAAHAAGAEERLGRLAVGTCCDLTVLDVDPQRASLEELEASSVLATVVAGEVVWSAPAR